MNEISNISNYDNNDIYLKNNFNNQYFLNNSISINSKLIDNDFININNSSNELITRNKFGSSFNELLPYSSITSFNDSILNLSKVGEKIEIKKKGKIKLNKTMNYMTNNEQKY